MDFKWKYWPRRTTVIVFNYHSVLASFFLCSPCMQMNCLWGETSHPPLRSRDSCMAVWNSFMQGHGVKPLTRLALVRRHQDTSAVVLCVRFIGPIQINLKRLRNNIAQCKCPRMNAPWTRGQASNIFASWVNCYHPWSTVRAWHPGRDLERIYSMCPFS